VTPGRCIDGMECDGECCNLPVIRQQTRAWQYTVTSSWNSKLTQKKKQNSFRLNVTKLINEDQQLAHYSTNYICFVLYNCTHSYSHLMLSLQACATFQLSATIHKIQSDVWRPTVRVHYHLRSCMQMKSNKQLKFLHNCWQSDELFYCSI